jgi:hypothetical protein
VLRIEMAQHQCFSQPKTPASAVQIPCSKHDQNCRNDEPRGNDRQLAFCEIAPRRGCHSGRAIASLTSHASFRRKRSNSTPRADFGLARGIIWFEKTRRAAAQEHGCLSLGEGRRIIGPTSVIDAMPVHCSSGRKSLRRGSLKCPAISSGSMIGRLPSSMRLTGIEPMR